MTRRRDFTLFASWLFPGEPVFEANPKGGRIPAEAKAVLQQVECATGVPWKYLEKATRLVLDGLAGLRCLWYLHGLAGTVVDNERARETPVWLQDLVNDWQVKRLREEKPTAVVLVLYGKGEIIEQDLNTGKVRRERLGKWLRKAGAAPEHLKDFETRQLPTWHWRVSAHPFDVLTMSFKRAWTSCMSPGGVAELGPLTDMAAGSAILFYYRPGAMEPCGRVVLRPALGPDDNRWVLSGGRLYGSGPALPVPGEIAEAINLAGGGIVTFTSAGGLCPLGKKGLALSRGIYSDTDRTHCHQTDEQYAEACENLRNAMWPAPALAIDELAEQARAAAPLVASVTRDDLTEAARGIAEAWVDADGRTVDSIENTIAACGRGDLPTREDLRNSALPDDDDTLDAVSRMVQGRLQEMLEERLAEVPIRALVIFIEDGAARKGRFTDELADCLLDLRGEVQNKPERIFDDIQQEIEKLVEHDHGVEIDVSKAYRVAFWPMDDLGENHRDAVDRVFRELSKKSHGWTYYVADLPPDQLDWSESGVF